MDLPYVMNSALWEAATEGHPCDVVLNKARVTRAGGATFDSVGMMYARAGDAPVLEILDPEGLGEERRTTGNPGDPSTPDSFWRVEADAIVPDVPRTPIQFRLTAERLTPEAENVHRNYPPVEPPRNRAVVRFKPWRAAFTAEVSEQEWGRSTYGLIRSEGVVHFSSYRPRVVHRGHSVVRTQEPFSTFTLHDGTRVQLRPSGDHVFVALDWPHERDFEQEQACTEFTFALGVAMGAQCQWLSAAERSGRTVAVRFFVPVEPWRLLSTSHGILPPEFGNEPTGFEALITALYRLCRERPDSALVVRGAHAMIWDSAGSTMQVRGLGVSAAVEALAREVDRTHLTRSPERSHEPPILDLVESYDSLKAHPEYARLKGLIQSAWGQRSPSDVLRDLQHGDLPLVHAAEFRAWKRLRNLLAHGRFHPRDHDGSAAMYRTLFLSQNLVNKLTLALARYEGPFRDYAQADWPLAPFRWQSPSHPGPSGPERKEACA